MRAVLLALILCACAAPPKAEADIRPDDLGSLRFSEDAHQREVFAAYVEGTVAWEAEFDRSLSARTPVAQQPDLCTAHTITRSQFAPWVRLAQAAPDRAAWDADAAEVRERLARVRRIAETYADGVDPAAPYVVDAPWSVATTRVALNAAEDPRVRELLRRTIRDQIFRITTYGDPAAPYVEGLSPRAREFWPRLVTSNLAEIDCANTAWLRAQVAEHGWFDIPRYGAQADQAAWLIVQHADRTPAFQGEMLALLEALPGGATDPRNRAYLWDRVAVKEGRPQRYGTQIECIAGEARAMGGVEEGVEERRAALRMQNFAEYRAMIGRVTDCGR